MRCWVCRGFGPRKLEHGVSDFGHGERLAEERDVDTWEGEQPVADLRAADLGRGDDDGEPLLHTVEDGKRLGEAEADVAAVGDEQVGGLASDFAKSAVASVALD